MPQLVTFDRVERAESLDPVVDRLRPAVTAVLGQRRIKDALHGVWLGHPLHPLLAQVPIGAWMSAGMLDLMPGTGRAASRLIAVGVAASLPTTASGLTDWTALHRQQARVGVVHAAANTTALGCYLLSLRARRHGHGVRGRLLGFAGLAAATVGGAIGGHLSFRLAAGVNHAEDVPHLVPPGWQPIASVGELRDGEPVARQLGGSMVMVVRQGEDIYALADHCSHLAGPLHQGSLGTDSTGEPCVTCPWHGSTFRLRDGSVVHGPAVAPQPSLRTRVIAGEVEVLLEGAG